MTAFADIQPTNLRCEYKTDPLGIDAAKPRLTWTLKADAPAQVQSAYQIMVASSPEALAADRGDRWDSGRVESDDTTFIEYAGAPLKSRDHCYWKVRVWDGDGHPSAWSAPALWSMGLLAPADWSADWIGYDAPVEAPEAAAPPAQEMGDAQWIWYPEGNPAESAPVGDVYFRTTFTVESGRQIAQAGLYITADNSARAYLNGVELQGVVTAFNQIMLIDLTSFLAPGEHVLAILGQNLGDAPNPAGMIARVVIDYASGAPAHFESGPDWKCARGEKPAGWNTTEYDDARWAAATAIGPVGTPPWPVPKFPKPMELPPPPQLRKEFTAANDVVRATLYATAFGNYEAYLNGQRVGDFVFAPGFTDYHKRVYYQTYDVTGLIRPGAENAFTALLGDGWYAGYLGFLPQLPVDNARDHYGDQPRFRGQLEIEYADGRTETIATDGAWKAAYGHIRESDMLMGETHDYAQATDGWQMPGFDDSAWDAVATGTPHDVPVQAHPGTPVTAHERIAAQSVNEVEPGVFVYNLGQNLAGWAEIRLDGRAGQRIRVRHGEMLNPDSSLYTTNLRKARAIDTYTLAEDGPVTLAPHFTFHGFQYVEITGVDRALPLENVVGVVLQSVIEPAGHFECSEPLLNQLFHNIIWGQKGNYLEIPTDCPQRDERMGWTGDAQFFTPTALFNMDCGAFFTKWLVDLIQDSQLEDGSFADVAPHVALGGGAVAWGDAAMICTYQLYRYYGDTRIIADHFPNLVRGMEFLERTSENGIRSKVGYGDWLNKAGGAKDEVIATAYFAYLAGLMREMAEVIGETDKAAYYEGLAKDVKDAFITNFIDAEGKILESSQTGYALAFTMDLVPEALKDKAAAQFEAEIARFDHHLATGFIGTPRLLPGLAEAGKIDLAYRLLMNTGYPSWLFQVTQGATTMWERWDGWTPDEGFQDPGMNSFNHYAFGAVGEWLYSAIGGIAPLTPGFKTFEIAPKPGGGLTWAKTHYRSIHGLIRSEWKIEGDRFTLEIEIPVNTEASIKLPASHRNTVLLDGRPAPGDEGALTLPSGVYTITATAG
ncbi:MAG: family 78 glycoside hydrolase catalytic domain [Candidatus Hydrogenedentes bacterium]|nr:family 78 glycoside hydrolase catalytic domain [Candidatus Hydrogenedentota bacterium]